MATIAEMYVDIGADATEFERETKRMQREMASLEKEMRSMSQNLSADASYMSNSWRQLSKEMRAAFAEQKAKLAPFKKQQQEVQYEFFKLAQSMKEYKGTTAEFMAELEQLGKRHKKITDEMLKNNDIAKMSFIESIATMMARSTQSEKIAQNFERMGNPLYTVNNGLLQITNNLEKMAKAGQPARLALEMLGPTANMKELNDMVTLINRGLMRHQMVAMAAAAASIMMFSALHDAAMETVPGYQQAFQEMLSAVRQAFQPMVDVFGAVMIKVYEFITFIANLISKFNEAHPVLAKVIQGFLLLIPLLTLLLSPLAIGIGLINGMRAAFASVWMLIGPLVTGLGAMMGTVLLVAGAIAVLGVALWALWTKTSWFKDAVISAWNAIKAAAIAVWNWIYSNVIQPVVNAIAQFVTKQMNKIRTFWEQNGQMILQAARNVWNVIFNGVIKPVMAAIAVLMQTAWPIIKNIVLSTWNAIKKIIDGAIDVILGIIKFFSALFTGDWRALWEAVKQILSGAVKMLIGYLQLNFIGGILKGIKAFGSTLQGTFRTIWNNVANAFKSGISRAKSFVSSGINGIVSFIRGLGSTFFNAGKGLIDMMAKGISNAASKVISKVKDLAQKVRNFLPFSPAKEGPLSDLDKLDFGGPIADSITGAMPTVSKLMSSLLQVPKIEPAIAGAPSGGPDVVNSGPAEIVVPVHLDGRVIARVVAPYMDTELRRKRDSKTRSKGGF